MNCTLMKRAHNRAIAILLGLALLLPACLPAPALRHPVPLPDHEGTLTIINFDMGQANAMLVVYKGRSLLIDCGGCSEFPRRASSRIPARLEALTGRRHLDFFLVTHYHKDHVGSSGSYVSRGGRGHETHTGLFDLLKRGGVTIDTILDRGFWSPMPLDKIQKQYTAALLGWLRRGLILARREVKVGDLINMGEGLKVEVICVNTNGLVQHLVAEHPDFVTRNPMSENDFSLGIKLVMGDFELFAAGDLTGKSIIRRFGPITQSYTDVESRIAGAIGAVEVYHVDHHGSAYSSNPCFTQVLHPQVSIISSGRNNRHGHPSLEVYRRLREYGHVYITSGVAHANAPLIVTSDIIEDDIEIVVAPNGKVYWVNGRPYESLTDEQEAARPRALSACDVPPNIHPDHYMVE